MALRQYNEWRKRADGIIEVLLTQGKVALIDECDAEKVLRYKWVAHREYGRWYAYSGETIGYRQVVILKMHRVILDAPDGMDVDHVNRDGLDNRRCNIRLATRSQNLANKRPRKGCTSKYKGVYKITDRPLSKPWRAQCADRRLGYYATEGEAAQAYNEAAREIFGEFACLNEL